MKLISDTLISDVDNIQSLTGTIKPLINSLRHAVSESTFVFYSSSVFARTTGMNMSVQNKKSQINQIITQYFFQKILSNLINTTDNHNSSIQNNFQ